MPRDYARTSRRGGRQQTRTSRRPSRPHQKKSRRKSRVSSTKLTTQPWQWLLTGLLIGLVITGLFYLKQHHHAKNKLHTQTHAQKITTKHKQKKIQATQKQQPAKPKFEFYTILPESNSENIHSQEKKRSSPQTASKYLLQIASVRHYGDADRLKAQLSLLGYRVFVSETSPKNKKWYRVNVGPFNTISDAEHMQDKLRTSNINSMLIKFAPATS